MLEFIDHRSSPLTLRIFSFQCLIDLAIKVKFTLLWHSYNQKLALGILPHDLKFVSDSVYGVGVPGCWSIQVTEPESQLMNMPNS